MSAKCAHVRPDGTRCAAWALHDSDCCSTHSLSADELYERAARGGRATQAKRRQEAGLRDSGRNRHYVSEPTLQRATEVIANLLDAELPDGEPDVLARAWGVLGVATLFRLSSAQRAELYDLLERVRPELVRTPYAARLLDLDAARNELIRLYEQGDIAAEDLPPGVLGFGTSGPVHHH
jgi:hypothetical protein